MFGEMMNDIVTLEKQNGEKFENIPADVQSNMIFINDAQLPIEEGDKLLRTLPNGLTESYIVVDRGFYEAFIDFPAHYQVKVRKSSTINTQQKSIVRNYNVTANAPIYGMQIGGNGNQQSVNVNEQNISDLVNNLRKLIATSTISELEKEDAIEALERISKLSNEELTPGVMERVTSRFGVISSIITNATGIYNQALPLLSTLQQYFNRAE